MDDRGQPIQVGAILLFGFLVIAFSIFQAVVVPQQNEEVEFDHNQDAQRDLVELRNSVARAANTGENGAASVRLGTRYQARLFGVNPGPASGLLQTTDPQPMYVTGGGNTDYSDLCPTANKTTAVSYAPTYNYYGNAPRTVYEHSFVFNQYADTERVETNARLLFGEKTDDTDDNVVNLVSLWGNVSKSGVQTVSVDTYSGKVNETTIQKPTLVLPTRASEATWREALNFSSDDPGAKSLSVSDGYVTIELVGPYTVVCSEVGFDRAPPAGVQNIGSASGGSNSGSTATPTSTPMPGSGGDPPTATINQTTASPKGGSGNHDMTVDWFAKDDTGLNGGTLTLKDSDGQQVSEESISPTGTPDSGQVTFQNVNGSTGQYTVELVVLDDANQSDSVTDTVTIP